MNAIKTYLESLRQFSFPRTRALEQELDALRKAHASVTADLEKLQENLQLTHEEDAQLLADLQQQWKQIESEHSNARGRVENLERSITDAKQRLKSTVELVASLEDRLKEESSRQEAGTHATETFLEGMQDEQQSLLKLISALDNTVQDMTTRLQDSPPPESKKTRPSLLKLMAICGALFATGILTGALIMQARQGNNEELAAVKQDMRDMRMFMQQHLDTQDTVLNELTLALNRKTGSNQAPVEKQSPAQEAEMPAADKLPHKTMTTTPDIRALQAGLIALGFDLGISRPNGEPGIKTRQALQEFRQFYLPDSDSQDAVVTEPLAALILKSADRARTDAARFRVGNAALAAIRLGSIRTGVDFSFLMEMARVESNFNPVAHAPKSSATGLFQFRDNAWLQSIRTFGADYGLEDAATRVKLIDDEEQVQHPIVRDPLQQAVLALRLNPRLSTLIAAENIKRNLQFLSARIRHTPVRTDLYLAHFLGPEAAVMFLKTRDEQPATLARDLFPKEAEINPRVFQNRKGQPRTVAKVYQWFDNRFNTGRYDERNPG